MPLPSEPGNLHPTRSRGLWSSVLDAEGHLVGVLSQRDVMAWYERTVEALAGQSVPAPDEYLRRLR